MSDEMTEPQPSPIPTVPPLVAAPRAARWRSPWVAGVAGLVLGAGSVGLAWSLSGPDSSAGAGPSPKPSAAQEFTLSGSLTLNNPTRLDFNHVACTGSDGYNDIVAGASVTVYDAEGKVVASGSLGPGRFVSSDSVAPCEFAIAVANVPAGPKFYQVEVSHRGKLTISADDAKAGQFKASLG